MLPDKDTVELIKQGYSLMEIAAAMNTDANLVELKATDLKRQGLALNDPDFRGSFL